MSHTNKYLSGIILSGGIAAAAFAISRFLPAGILGETLLALIIGMLLNPLVCRNNAELSAGNRSRKIRADTDGVHACRRLRGGISM